MKKYFITRDIIFETKLPPKVVTRAEAQMRWMMFFAVILFGDFFVSDRIYE